MESRCAPQHEQGPADEAFAAVLFNAQVRGDGPDRLRALRVGVLDLKQIFIRRVIVHQHSPIHGESWPRYNRKQWMVLEFLPRTQC